MFSGNQNQFAMPFINKRLVTLLDGVDAGNGTPLAAAVTSALEVDMRISSLPHQTLPAFSDDELFDLASQVFDTLNDSGSRTTLPFGTVLESRELGEILIGGERWTLDAGQPGLHPIWTTRRDAHGPNLELLHRLIAKKTRNLACRCLGLPQPVLVCDVDERNLLHFAPLAEAGEVVLQCWAHGTGAPRFCGALPEQIEAFAEAIVKDMRVFWKRRKSIARQATEVRAIANSHVADNDAEVDAIIVDMSFQFDDNDLDFHVHYIGVDVALRRGVVLGFMPAFKLKLIENGQSFGSPWGVSERKKERAALNSNGADGRITELAASVLASGRVDPKQVLADLSSAYDTTVEIHTKAAPIFATFYWADGTISVELIRHGSLDWAGDQLELYGIELPETKLVAMAGRPISDLAELPFGGDIVVERIVPIDSGMRFHLSEKTFLIEFASGNTWECPKGLL